MQKDIKKYYDNIFPKKAQKVITVINDKRNQRT